MKLGDILINKYICVCKLGHGKFSEVWMCFEFKTRKYFAIKIFDDPEVAQHEMEMIDIIKRINSRHCLSYIETFTCNKVLHIVQPLMAGSLYDIMKSQYSHGLPFNAIIKIIYDLISALDNLHNTLGIIHTDIKPENILLVGHTLEIDFAIAKINNYLTGTSKKTPCKTIATQIKKLFTLNKTYEENNENDMCGSESGTSSILTASDIHSDHSSHIDRMYLNSDCSSEISISENLSEVIIDSSYISTPVAMLGDFGNSIVVADANQYGDLQTRHYRAPEIILRHNINEKSDIWAVGCTFYELLTGEVLFNPIKSDGITSDRQHLYDFQKILGDIPDYLKNGRKKIVFFRTDGTLKNFYEQSHININDLIKQKRCELSNEQFCDTIEFLSATLEYNVDKRPSASICKTFHLFRDRLTK